MATQPAPDTPLAAPPATWPVLDPARLPVETAARAWLCKRGLGAALMYIITRPFVNGRFLSSHPLVIAATTKRILDAFGVPYRIATGYANLPGKRNWSVPHLWFEHEGGMVTDLWFDGPDRAVKLMGTNLRLAAGDDVIEAAYTRDPVFRLPPMCNVLLKEPKPGEPPAQGPVIETVAHNLDDYFATIPEQAPYLMEVLCGALEAAFALEDRVVVRGAPVVPGMLGATG